MLVVEHAQIFAKGVAEDLQLQHVLGMVRPSQHTTPDCPMLAGSREVLYGSVEPQSLSQKLTLLEHG